MSNDTLQATPPHRDIVDALDRASRQSSLMIAFAERSVGVDEQIAASLKRIADALELIALQNR